jgi:hypothetical protein
MGVHWLLLAVNQGVPVTRWQRSQDPKIIKLEDMGMRNLPYRALVVSMLATWLAGCGPSDTTTTDAVPETVPVVAKMPAQRPHRAWFGELHVHSSNSPDAFMLGVRTSPEDAYRYARGEAIDHISGVKIRASAALDFMAVTDHAEYLGLLPLLAALQGELAVISLLSQAQRHRMSAVLAINNLRV